MTDKIRNKDSLSPALDTQLMRLGQNLKLARKRRKWSIDKVAQLINSSKGTIGNAENGSSAVGIGIYLSLMELYRFEVAIAEATEASCDAVGIALSDQRLAGNKAPSKQELSSDF